MLLSNLQNSIFGSCICPASDKSAKISHTLFLEFLFCKYSASNIRDCKCTAEANPSNPNLANTVIFKNIIII